ncbi:unnamed protein product [Hapterophycus canaliculatus]
MVDVVESKAIKTEPEDPRVRNDDTDNPTLYARRAAKLDSRVEIRRHPKRGRGLFALGNIPAGTEVMRVPAAGAVSRQGHGSCSGCLLSANTVGPLQPCHGCSLSFCASCKIAGTARGAKGVGIIAIVHSGPMCELTKEFFGICATSRGGAGPSHDSLRLLADVVVKRKAGIIDDEEWALLISLESDDNEAGSMSLTRPELESCVKLFKRLLGIDISQEDVQTMYRRQAAAITRNVHTVAPNVMVMDGGPVQGLFPCGALTNHSCRPNMFFHCMAEPSPSVDGPPAIKQVFRTVCDIKAGDELCYSYISSSFAARSVVERRSLLEGWGFRCGCERCKTEVAERRRVKKDPTPMNENARRIIDNLRRVPRLCQWGNTSALKKETWMPLLNEAMHFCLRGTNEHVSWVLLDDLALALSEATELVGVLDLLFRFEVCGHVANVLSKFHQPAAITFFYQQYTFSTKIRASGLGTSQQNSLKVYEAAGRQSRSNAEELQKLFYGKKGTRQSI